MDTAVAWQLRPAVGRSHRRSEHSFTQLLGPASYLDSALKLLVSVCRLGMARSQHRLSIIPPLALTTYPTLPSPKIYGAGALTAWPGLSQVCAFSGGGGRSAGLRPRNRMRFV